MNGKYDDMIHLPHPTSSRHPRMSMADRAAQFSPFAALTGHGAAISETARLTDRQIELSEDAKALLDQKQSLLTERLAEHPEVSVTWFRADSQKEGGRYEVAQGRLRQIVPMPAVWCWRTAAGSPWIQYWSSRSLRRRSQGSDPGNTGGMPGCRLFCGFRARRRREFA